MRQKDFCSTKRAKFGRSYHDSLYRLIYHEDGLPQQTGLPQLGGEGDT
jgi:hypothetical protein